MAPRKWLSDGTHVEAITKAQGLLFVLAIAYGKRHCAGYRHSGTCLVVHVYGDPQGLSLCPREGSRSSRILPNEAVATHVDNLVSIDAQYCRGPSMHTCTLTSLMNTTAVAWVYRVPVLVVSEVPAVLPASDFVLETHYVRSRNRIPPQHQPHKQPRCRGGSFA